MLEHQNKSLATLNTQLKAKMSVLEKQLAAADAGKQAVESSLALLASHFAKVSAVDPSSLFPGMLRAARCPLFAQKLS